MPFIFENNAWLIPKFTKRSRSIWSSSRRKCVPCGHRALWGKHKNFSTLTLHSGVERKCLCSRRCKCTPTRKAKLLWTTSQRRAWIINVSSSCARRQSRNTQASDHLTLDLLIPNQGLNSAGSCLIPDPPPMFGGSVRNLQRFRMWVLSLLCPVSTRRGH